jgi:hypothetical protein
MTAIWTSSLMMTTMMTALMTILFLLGFAEGFVIAPPWANPTINPCSEQSWQLIYWPADGKCYSIFEQGPCPDTQELAFHSINGQVMFTI